MLMAMLLALWVRAAEAITIRVPEHFPTIQQAIDFAWSGDEIVLADGVYTGPGNVELDFAGKPITLRSEHGPAACVIDGELMARIIVLNDGELASTRIEGLTLTRGFGASGGAIFVAPGGSPTIAC
jgi:hypothetical protein